MSKQCYQKSAECFLPWLNEEIKEDIKMKHYFEKKAHTKGLEIY